jgi:hypothetical protein
MCTYDVRMYPHQCGAGKMEVLRFRNPVIVCNQDADISQAQMGRARGVSEDVVSNIENVTRSLPMEDSIVWARLIWAVTDGVTYVIQFERGGRGQSEYIIMASAPDRGVSRILWKDSGRDLTAALGCACCPDPPNRGQRIRRRLL